MILRGISNFINKWRYKQVAEYILQDLKKSLTIDSQHENKGLTVQEIYERFASDMDEAHFINKVEPVLRALTNDRSHKVMTSREMDGGS